MTPHTPAVNAAGELLPEQPKSVHSTSGDLTGSYAGAAHTPGPWRWEFNAKHKSMQLVGGVPRYDLTVMDFERWGMHGAIVRLREDVDGMNIMHRLCERPDWIAPFPGRSHHAHWCASVAHPDMQLIEAAPDLLNACEKAREWLQGWASAEPYLSVIEAAIAKATGGRALEAPSSANQQISPESSAALATQGVQL